MQLKLAPWNWFKPSSKMFFFYRSKAVLLFWIICVIYVLCLSCFRVVHCCLVVTCWERADLMDLVCDVSLCFCHFPMWYPGSVVQKLLYTYYTFNFCFLLMKSSITARWWHMEDRKELVVFVKNRLQSIYMSINSCVYNLKTHTFFQWFVM